MQIQQKETSTISKSAINSYFSSINQEKFNLTADLFTEQGTLFAPFEKPIIGKKAIALYLEKEAKGMELIPLQETYEATEDEFVKVKVTGKVKTSLFSVNVAWYFELNSNDRIVIAEIKLIASPKELLGLQKSKEKPIESFQNELKQ